MILNTSTNKIETNLKNSTKFTIVTSQKAFDILSSLLYENKIKAIIRELSCNAYDSHIAANNDEPFVVYLPDIINPTFAIQDFGTGLSEEDVLNLYTTYFKSTKNNSNDFVGALGVGSKSPFAYTDSFMIESIYGGKKSTYTAYLDKERIPVCSKMQTVPCDEHTGMKISFAVKINDFYRFSKEAAEVFYFFDKHPRVIGEYDKIDYKRFVIDEDTNIIMRHNGAYRSNHILKRQLQIVQGNIAYTVDENQINIKETNFLKNTNILIKVPIGSVSFTASRESLHYDKATIKFLDNLVKEKDEAIRQYIYNSYINEKTYANACSKAIKTIYDLTYDSYTRSNLTFEWQGQKIEYDFSISRENNMLCYLYKMHRGNKIIKSKEFTCSYSNKNVFILNDATRIRDRIKKLNETENADNYIVIETKDLKNQQMIFGEKAITALGNPDIVKASDIKIDKAAKSEKRALTIKTYLGTLVNVDEIGDYFDFIFSDYYEEQLISTLISNARCFKEDSFKKYKRHQLAKDRCKDAKEFLQAFFELLKDAYSDDYEKFLKYSSKTHNSFDAIEYIANDEKSNYKKESFAKEAIDNIISIEKDDIQHFEFWQKFFYANMITRGDLEKYSMSSILSEYRLLRYIKCYSINKDEVITGIREYINLIDEKRRNNNDTLRCN